MKKLKPDNLTVIAGKCFVDDSCNFGTRTKDVNDIDVFLNVRERIAGRPSWDLICVGIDRDDPVSLSLETLRNLVDVLSRCR